MPRHKAAQSDTCSVCAVASRFYDARSDLHTKLSELARNLAFQVPARGYKSVEIVQAYLINVLWGCGPVQRYEQDQTWMLLGMAIRFVPEIDVCVLSSPYSAATRCSVTVASCMYYRRACGRGHALAARSLLF